MEVVTCQVIKPLGAHNLHGRLDPFLLEMCQFTVCLQEPSIASGPVIWYFGKSRLVIWGNVLSAITFFIYSKIRNDFYLYKNQITINTLKLSLNVLF